MKFVLFDFFIHFGGAPQLAADTIKRLAADNEVEVVNVYGVCQEYLKTLEDAGIRTHVLVPEVKNVIIGYQNNKVCRLWELIRRIPLFWRLRKRLIRKILGINPDVIWTTSDHALLFLMLSPSLNRYPAVRYDCGCRKAADIRGWQRLVMKRRAVILMTSSTETAKQLQMVGIKSERIRVVFETIDITSLLEKSKAPLEAPLPGLERYPRLLVPATLLRTKGQHTAIKAAARLVSQGISPTLWLAGDVVGNDYSYLDYLKGLVSELGVSENVYFLGWRHDIPAVMAKSDIVVLPTHTEGFGRVALEAMLLRRPAVTTPAGGMKDSIQDGYDGLFFPVDDDEALCRQLVRLVTDHEFAAKLVENGYRTVTEKFNAEAHTKRVLDAFAVAMESVSI
ncbi:MAG: glycosyltransferase family 4 protein [Sedimentisphaerales bacterium]